MNLTNSTKILPKAVILALSLTFLTAGAVNTCAAQQTSEDLLLKIMDLHSQLMGNEVFLAQAKMLGAYLEAAQPLEETKKVKIYKTVLQILTKIKESPISALPTPSKTKEDATHKTSEAEQEDKTVFVPGAALLENFKADSIETMPRLPVIRTYWNRDLAYSGGFLLPDRYSEIGRQSRYVARFSFYYEATELGDYGFTIVHGGSNRGIWSGRNPNACKLTVGGIEAANVQPNEPSGQGVCTLRKGFHRVEFWLVSAIGNMYQPEWPPDKYNYYPDYSYANFEVKVLRPNTLDAVPITKDMILLKKE
jgi:hypothetical protein